MHAQVSAGGVRPGGRAQPAAGDGHGGPAGAAGGGGGGAGAPPAAHAPAAVHPGGRAAVGGPGPRRRRRQRVPEPGEPATRLCRTPPPWHLRASGGWLCAAGPALVAFRETSAKLAGLSRDVLACVALRRSGWRCWRSSRTPSQTARRMLAQAQTAAAAATTAAAAAAQAAGRERAPHAAKVSLVAWTCQLLSLKMATALLSKPPTQHLYSCSYSYGFTGHVCAEGQSIAV
jgi:hypothetical protein